MARTSMSGTPARRRPAALVPLLAGLLRPLDSLCPLALLCSLALCCSLASASAADKPATWIELRTPHFTVYSDGGEKTARDVAVQFEQMRNTFVKILDNGRVDPGQPILIIAARDEKSLGALLPEYYGDKQRIHPAGLYVGGAETIHILLRADVTGDLPYQIIYHEYTHQIMHLSYAFLPTWLDEGYAQLFGNSVIAGRSVTIGYAPRWQMQALQRMTLLPLEQLFAVNQKSPYYNEANQVNVFYQESWALVHLLFFDPAYKKADALGTYTRLVNNGVDPVEAARQSFGDLKALMNRLQNYVGAAGYYSGSVNSPIEGIDKGFTVRTLSEAETDAMLGDASMSRGRWDDARPLLEQAAKIDPNLAVAQEDLGILHQRLDERDAAAPYFARATELNSASFLAYYFDGAYKARQGTSAEAAAEASLKKSIALNANFAPARVALASLDLKHPEKLDEALGAAQAAVLLEPAQWRNQFMLAQVMAARKQIDQARTIAARIAASQSDPAAQTAVTGFLDYLTRLEQYNQQVQARQSGPAAPSLPPAAALASSQEVPAEEHSGPPKLQRLADRSDAPAGQSDSQSEGNATAPPVASEQPAAATPASAASSASATAPRLYSMLGTFKSVDCTKNPEVTLTLTSGALSMRLHAGDLAQVSFLGPDGKPQTRTLPCAQLQNLAVRTYYLLLSGGDYDGELKAIKPDAAPVGAPIRQY